MKVEYRMWDCLTNMEWVFPLRSDFLTSFFSIFPFFASDIFYFAIIACGYWFTGSRFYQDLGILITLSTLLNYGLKILFKIPRPAVVHLVETHQTFGFPSGDIQVALMVWGLLAWKFQKGWFWILSALMVLGIGFSRLYLGVHTPLDLLGGASVGVGLTVLYEWYKNTLSYQKTWLEKPFFLAMGLFGVVLLYGGWMFPDFHFIWLVPAGALIGIGMSIIMREITGLKGEEFFTGSYKKVGIASCSLACAYFGLRSLLPWKIPTALFLKSVLMSLLILYLIPLVFDFIAKRKKKWLPELDSNQ